MKKITSIAEFEQAVHQEMVIVNFSALWCGPCKMMEPHLKTFQTKYDYEIYKVDVDLFPALAELYGILSIPTLVIFSQGKEIKRQTGFQNLASLEKFVK